MARARKGQCLCGKIKFSVTIAPDTSAAACHCGMCRRWSSGPSMSIVSNNFELISGTEHLQCYQSSDWGERGFCNRCGTGLFWRERNNSSVHYTSLFTLEESEHDSINTGIFVDDAPNNYDFAHETERLTGAELMAKHFPNLTSTNESAHD